MKMGTKKSKIPTIPPERLPTVQEEHQDRYLERRMHWMWRLRPYVEKIHEQCKICQFGSRCHRVPMNEAITSKILSGKECPDFKSVWKKILSDEKKYDWGF